LDAVLDVLSNSLLALQNRPAISLLELLYVAGIGLLAGTLGTGLGGVLMLFLRKPSQRFLSVILGFSAGIMLAIVFFSLMPEAFATGSMVSGIIGLLLGVALIVVLDLLIPHSHHFAEDSRSAHFIRTGILIGIGIALHNLPEGIAVGASYVSTIQLGIGVALLMALHNIPEGIAMATPMVIGKMNKFKIVFYTMLAGVPTGLGAFVGAYFGGISPLFLSIALGFAGGAMLYITFDELIPDAQEIAEGHTATFGIVVGVITGLLLATTFNI